ncbi:zinc finger MYND domain-containing protein [Aspergillus homomorphus CBS 101889]|uniref:MYND-type domain-containing protein n=1 Tax=Aspergillus homomorphus (strain CBS 101889) TaxID=1450537 RepID=A0A395I849_ASPHC|nr:hypothetical protein BO97DRAFT_411377 [Aspergillus homomorphus CBS 101889]RAL16136.1 hypothetical protein BO97DRAFT_411377 [Aspergillus homomorphus CBS 101889]
MALQYPDLRDIEHFPGFADIPIEDLDTGETTPGTDGCLLLEILSIQKRPVLVIGTRSNDLHMVTLRFEGPDHGHALSESPHLKVGYTIAVMHARKHQFGHEVYGMCLHDYRSIKLLPSPLDDIFHLSDVMKTWPLNFAPHKKCHWCGHEPKPIVTCLDCGVVGYCGVACQVACWNFRSHKEFCKILGDQNFRSLVTEMARE